MIPRWYEALVDCGPCKVGHPETFCMCEHGHGCLWCLLAERDATITRLAGEVELVRLALHAASGMSGQRPE